MNSRTIIRFCAFVSVVILSSSIILSQAKKDLKGSTIMLTEGTRLYQSALEAGTTLSVLFLALRPGYEDLPAMAYYRLGKGARVYAVYVTNGEAGESDFASLYPNELAAKLRSEAGTIASELKSESYFLNMPDPGAASDSSSVWNDWNKDTLRARLMRTCSEFRPDIVVLCGDRSAEFPSYSWKMLHQVSLEAIRRIQPPRSKDDLDRSGGIAYWGVQRYFVENQSAIGLAVRVKTRHPLLRTDFLRVGRNLASHYRTQAVQRTFWKQPDSIRYRVTFSMDRTKISSLEDRLPSPAVKFSWIERNLRNLSASVLKGPSRPPGQNIADQHLRKLVAIMDSVDYQLARNFRSLGAGDRRVVLRWKEGLQNLRNRLLGVDVKYSFSETILTNLQLTELTVDAVSGIREGTLQLVFPSVHDGWVLNEKREQQLALTLREQYRLISPRILTFHLPAQIEGLQNNRLFQPVTFYIVQMSKSKETSFVETVTTPFRFAPKFAAEILTPVVFVSKGEEVVVRLTNHSRDGVADALMVEDPLVESNEVRFRLSSKESSHLDTLRLRWKDGVPSGSYLISLAIGGIKVGQFAARSFDVSVDTTKRVGILTTLNQSITETTLRRLGIRARRLDLDAVSDDSLSGLDVLIIERRFLTLGPDISRLRSAFDRFVQEGGHLLILAQDQHAWNRNPMWNGLHLQGTTGSDEQTPVWVDTLNRILQRPNEIKASEWEDWLWYRGYNNVTTRVDGGVEVPVRRSSDGAPLVVSRREGRGRRTYVDLSLTPQWLNIHAGAFRLFANLVSY